MLLDKFSENEELVNLALSVLSSVCSCRNVCKVMNGLEGFVKTLSEILREYSSNGNLCSKIF